MLPAGNEQTALATAADASVDMISGNRQTRCQARFAIGLFRVIAVLDPYPYLPDRG